MLYTIDQSSNLYREDRKGYVNLMSQEGLGTTLVASSDSLLQLDEFKEELMKKGYSTNHLTEERGILAGDLWESVKSHIYQGSTLLMALSQYALFAASCWYLYRQDIRTMKIKQRQGLTPSQSLKAQMSWMLGLLIGSVVGVLLYIGASFWKFYSILRLQDLFSLWLFQVAVLFMIVYVAHRLHFKQSETKENNEMVQ